MNNTALITGASSGIGLELAKIHAEKGGNLILVARNADKLSDLKTELEKKHGISVQLLFKDLSVQSSSQEVYDEVKKLGLHIDILINNAGFGTFGNYWETDWEKERDMINVHVMATAGLTKFFLKDMVACGSGKIMNVSSIAAFQPGPLMAMYYATKAFILHFSEALSEETKDTGVTVTALCPGPTHTHFAENGDLEDSKLMTSLPVHTAREVAEYGYNAMLEGKRVAIHGVLNNIIAESTRFAPRALTAKFAKKIQERKNKGDV